MPKKITDVAALRPDQCFVNELRGENPPSFSAMEDLYRMASELFALRPWHLLDESQLILVRHPEKNEICYCSVMGALGEVFSMHAYLGTEGYRLFRKTAAGKMTDPGEFLAAQNCIYVEFVPRTKLEGPERKLLAALRHPVGRGIAVPIFRTIRPGFHPWFVTSEETRILAACIRAVLAICSEIAGQHKANYWSRADTFPLVVPGKEAEQPYRVELIKPVLTAEPPLPRAQAREEDLALLRSRDYVVRGVMELDYFVSVVAVGKKNERKACTCITLAVDANSGIVYPPELTNPGVPPEDALMKALIRAIQGSGAFPTEIRVRSRRLKDCLLPVAESLGLSIALSARLPALDEAREHLLRFFEKG